MEQLIEALQYILQYSQDLSEELRDDQWVPIDAAKQIAYYKSTPRFLAFVKKHGIRYTKAPGKVLYNRKDIFRAFNDTAIGGIKDGGTA